MDLTLAMGGGLFNMRVAVVLVQNGEVLLERFGDFLTLVGGRVQYQETIQEAAIREVHEELGIAISAPRLVACVENFFVDSDVKRSFIQEYLFVFRAEIAADARVVPTINLERHTLAMLTALPLKPKVLTEIISDGSGRFQFYHQVDAELMPINGDDMSFFFDGSRELHVRATAMIRNQAGEVLIDHKIADHPVTIGGRMQQFETVEQGLYREILEELEAVPDAIQLVGIAEDFFALDERSIRLLSFVFQVDIAESAMKPTDEIVLKCYSPAVFCDLPLKSGSAKSFVEPDADFQYVVYYE